MREWRSNPRFQVVFEWFQHIAAAQTLIWGFLSMVHTFFSVQNQVSDDFNPYKATPGPQDRWDLWVPVLNKELLIV